MNSLNLDSPGTSGDSPPSIGLVYQQDESLTTNPKNSKNTTRKSGKPFQMGPSICQICFGRATGHHYDVASCNGCKSFFRRVTIEKLKYTCVSNGRCFEKLEAGQQMPKCRACRHKKCIQAGMNHLGIQSELKQELERNKTKLKNVETGKEIATISAVNKVEKPLISIESRISNTIEQLIRLDIQVCKFRDCSYNPEKFSKLREIIKNEHSLLSIADKVGPMKEWPPSLESVEEVRARCEQQLPYRHVPSIKRWFLYDLLIVVELSKTFSFFTELSENDRFYLLRDTALMASNLNRAFYSYDQKSDQILRPDGIQYKGIFRNKVDFGRQNHLRCLSSLIRLSIEKIEFLLIRAIALCNNAVFDISDQGKKTLSAERDKYTMCLFHHTMIKYGPNHGPARMAELLNLMDVLEHQQKIQRDMHIVINLKRPRDHEIPMIDEVMRNCA